MLARTGRQRVRLQTSVEDILLLVVDGQPVCRIEPAHHGELMDAIAERPPVGRPRFEESFTSPPGR